MPVKLLAAGLGLCIHAHVDCGSVKDLSLLDLIWPGIVNGEIAMYGGTVQTGHAAEAYAEEKCSHLHLEDGDWKWSESSTNEAEGILVLEYQLADDAEWGTVFICKIRKGVS